MVLQQANSKSSKLCVCRGSPWHRTWALCSQPNLSIFWPRVPHETRWRQAGGPKATRLGPREAPRLTREGPSLRDPGSALHPHASAPANSAGRGPLKVQRHVHAVRTLDLASSAASPAAAPRAGCTGPPALGRGHLLASRRDVGSPRWSAQEPAPSPGGSTFSHGFSPRSRGAGPAGGQLIAEFRAEGQGFGVGWGTLFPGVHGPVSWTWAPGLLLASSRPPDLSWREARCVRRAEPLATLIFSASFLCVRFGRLPHTELALDGQQRGCPGGAPIQPPVLSLPLRVRFILDSPSSPDRRIQPASLQI